MEKIIDEKGFDEFDIIKQGLNQTNFTKEQWEFLTIVCNNIQSLSSLRYEELPEITEKYIFPLLEKFNINWTELALIGHFLDNVAYCKHQRRLESNLTKNNKIIKSLLKNTRLLMYNQSIKDSKGILDLSDSIFCERGIGYDYNKDKSKFASYNLRSRFDILKKYGFKCVYCGRSPPDVTLQLEHIHPKSRGGESSDNNYVPACFECNSGKKDKILDNEQVDLIKQRLFSDETIAT